MNKPTLIYIDQYSDGNLSNEWHKYSSSTENTTALEFIRKDFLVELLNRLMEAEEKASDEDRCAAAKYNAFWVVRDKINSL